MARTMSKISLILIPLLCLGSSTEAKNWRYWPNIGCFEFSFERTVFFELTNEATRLSTIEGSELPAIVNTSIVPSSDNELQLQHILAGSIRNSSTNTPEECITACNATGFAYAGLQDGMRCVCTNEAPTAQTDGSNCNTGCPGNGSYSCGGSWTMDLHQNPAYHSSQLTYFGCFKNTFNDLDRMLFEGTYNNFRNNTPDWCVAYCTSGGFDYAGLQYGSQCICTNSGPQGTSDAGQCTYGCAGDSSIKMCGGLGYINIFNTDAHKTTIDDWGCGNTVQDTYYQKWYDDMGHCNITPGGNGGSGGAPLAPTTTMAPCSMDPVIVSNPDDYDRYKKADNALNNEGSDWENRWMGKNGMENAKFVYDLGCTTSVSKLKLRNACNGLYKDSGTKDYIVSVSNSENGPWTEFKNGTFENPIPNCSSTTQSHNDRNPIFEFDANLVTARYVQFRCLSYYATRCALNFIEVY